jgi:hypothetical protein
MLLPWFIVFNSLSLQTGIYNSKPPIIVTINLIFLSEYYNNARVDMYIVGLVSR